MAYEDVTFQRLGVDAQPEMDKLKVMLVKRGAREVKTSAEAQLIFIAAFTVPTAHAVLDRLGFEERKRAVLVGCEGGLDVRQAPAQGSLAALLESHRPLGALEAASIRKWRSYNPGFLGSKRLADRMKCGFHKGQQTSNYAAWLNAPGESAAELALALLRAITANPAG